MRTIELERVYTVPRLTPLEIFCYKNAATTGGAARVATELNRSTRVIFAAWNRADDKVAELRALIKRANDRNNRAAVDVLEKELKRAGEL